MNHTMLGRVIYEVRVNGEPVDEAALNAGVAGAYGVPVALVTGDDQVCGDAQRRFPGVVTAPVKRAIDRYAARSRTPQKARELIREGARRAVDAARSGNLQPYAVRTPVTIEVDFKRTAPANMTTLIPGVERMGPRTIAIRNEEYVTAFRAFVAAVLFGMHTSEGGL
jgi:D-amino peptidase